jgi:hypothetical protein
LGLAFLPESWYVSAIFQNEIKEIRWVKIMKKKGGRGGEGHGRIKINYPCNLFNEAGPDSIK